MKPETADRFIQLSGPLFEDVQQSGLFDDSKTFVDSVPKADPRHILKTYDSRKAGPYFNLKAFVYEHFLIPGEDSGEALPEAGSMDEHIERLWDYLSRQPDEEVSESSTLIPLPYPYIVPGGRFREIYYWDTYFTAEGLAASGRIETVENLVRNFTYLVDKVGHVPNGNRYYYISRSQPPFLVLLVDLLARHKGQEAIREYLPALQKEYRFWMDGHDSCSPGSAYRRLVNIDGKHLLNRYWDDRPLPREESWREDFELATVLDPKRSLEFYRHIRAGAESGWDFSSRWLRDGKSLNTIHTTDILPVDLNALLYFLELRLGEWTSGTESKAYAAAAERRRATFDKIFWDSSSGYYFDYDWVDRRRTQVWSLAGCFPLFLNLADNDQGTAVATALKDKFLKEGGLVSTLHQTGQQWDYPNGWAPLQWVAVKGLLNYSNKELADAISDRWLTLNEKVFKRTGKMMEKYNVCDLSLEAGGGEYPLQDGFGWTNGVAAALKKMSPEL